VDKYLIPWDKTNIGPRIGVAWNVHPKTVIRAAYGIFYSGEENQGGNPNRGESVPFNSSPQLQRPSGVSSFAPNPFFAGGAAIGGVSGGYPTNVFTTLGVTSLQFRSVARNFRNPMVQKWNFTVQQQLPGQMAFELGYQGNYQSHSLLQPDFNACPNFGTLDPTINCNLLRPVPEIGSISGTATFGYGNYNALTAQLNKRMTAGLQFLTAYTFGQALATSGTTLSGSTGLYTRDLRDYSKNYSNASWDVRQNFTTGLNYELPFGRGKQFGANWNRALDLIAGGWQANALASFRTGNPYTVRATGCQGVFPGGCSPDLIRSNVDPNEAPPGGRRPSQWFNTANFTAPSPLTQGTLGLQTNYGPPTRTVDFSLFKDFSITERWRVQFRAESFNIGNTPQFNVPDNTLGNVRFGQVTSTQVGSERHLQFQLRLQF
jgi:hypothetical protein